MVNKQELWKAMSEPLMKNCENCKHGFRGKLITPDAWVDKLFSDTFCSTCTFLLSPNETRTKNQWEYLK